MANLIQPSSTSQSAVARSIAHLSNESRRCWYQPSGRLRNHSGSVGEFSRGAICVGVRWKTTSDSAYSASWGITWTPVAPVPMMATRLSRSLSRFPLLSPPVYS